MIGALIIVEVVEPAGATHGAAFEAVAGALAGAGIRAHVEERDESQTMVYHARDVYPASSPAQVDAAFRAILAGRYPV